MPKGADEEGAFPTNAAQGMGGPARELPEIAGAHVGQLVLLPVTPQTQKVGRDVLITGK